MDNKLYFVFGAIVGAAGGSIGTYFLVKDRFEAEKIEAIEEYAEHAEMRLERQIEALKDESVGDLDKKLGEKLVNGVEDPEEAEIRNNEGVKKYHHYDGAELPEYASKRVFGVDKKQPMTSNYVEKKESKLVNEITEQEFETPSEEYTKQTIDILYRSDDTTESYWGYETDNQITVQAKFGKTIEELFGSNIVDQLLDATPADEGIGILYFRNNELMTDFEVILHSDLETYFNEGE